MKDQLATFCQEISYLQREDIEQLLSEKFASEGIQDWLKYQPLATDGKL